MERNFLTIREAAEYIGVSIHTMRHYATRRVFPMYRNGGGKLLYVELDELEKWLKAQRIEKSLK